MNIFEIDDIICQISINLTLVEIYKLCSINKKYNLVLYNNHFWKLKYIYDYGDDTIDDWKKAYIHFKPRRPYTSFTGYMADNILRIINENPGVKNTEIPIIAAKEWKSIQSDIEDKYIKKSKQDRIRYIREMNIYNKNHENMQRNKKYIPKNKLFCV